MSTTLTKPAENTIIQESVLSRSTFGLLILGTLAGLILAALLLPIWTPRLVESLLGTQPKAYWYLSRASAMVSYAWLWASMALGLLITNRLARLWPGGPAAVDMHEYTSLVGLLFALFHALILLGDHYINYKLLEILLPFASINFRPFAVGLGQLAFYGLLLVTITFYLRRTIGARSWRLIHFASFGFYAMDLLHAISAGTDTSSLLVQVYYWVTGGILLWLLLYRVIQAKLGKQPQGVRRTA